MKECICFLARFPSQTLLDIAADVAKCASNIRVTIMCDDAPPSSMVPPAGVELLHMSKNAAIGLGYYQASHPCSPFACTAWDKALCIFARDTEQDYVWFIEDDVFIPSAQHLISMIESSHKAGAGYVSSHSNENFDGDLGWHWALMARNNIPLPWYGGLAVIAGMCRTVLDGIKEYADEHKQLLYIEVMFNTIAMQKGVKVFHPPEITHLSYNGKHNDIPQIPKSGEFFHPIKDPRIYTELYQFS